MWIAVQLDDGKMVLVESTYPCENNYCPDYAIIYKNYNPNNIVVVNGNTEYIPEFYADTPDMFLIPHNNRRGLSNMDIYRQTSMLDLGIINLSSLWVHREQVIGLFPGHGDPNSAYSLKHQ